MPFKLFTSNRLEVLVESLARELTRPLSSPLQPEVILVQSRGMERWVSLQLATKLGICANVRFPFPNAFLDEIFARTGLRAQPMGRRAGLSDPYHPGPLTWRIMKKLAQSLPRPEFVPLQRYLQEPGRDLKRFQLAARLADLFDQYLLYRPELIARWEAAHDRDWQAELWRMVRAEIDAPHRAALHQELLKLLEHAEPGSLDLPERLSVFGISALPPFHMEILDGLSRHAQVNLFLMNPCREYWGLIRSEKEIQRATSGQLTLSFAEDDLHYDRGNPLLASLGAVGRAFFDFIEARFQYVSDETFIEPGDDTLLHRIQSDILSLRDPTAAEAPKAAIDPNDRSLQFHVCHSPRREVEVLHDQLLHLFETCEGLKPGDVLVMAPDIEPYLPFIEAVFDLPADDPRRIPYTVADRTHRRENPLADAFLGLLELARSRLGASEVFRLLEVPAVYRRFGLTEDDLATVRHWITQAGIRWARDADDRRRWDLPAFDENTWRAGLERLLLGYALPGDATRLFHGRILPLDQVEGQQAEVLGRFLEFLDRLFHAVDQLQTPRGLEAWYTVLEELLETFFLADDQTYPQIEAVRQILEPLTWWQPISGFDEPVSLRVIHHYLETRFSQEGAGYGFLTGGITFCSLLPMRSIPARVIALLGMNYDAYPRRDRALAFDRMRRQPQPGDPARRRDDRYLFLEALLSAREVLYVSYVGQSIKDNSEIPPSVVVSELLDYIRAAATPPHADGEDPIAPLQTVHALQAFSPSYFKGDERRFSYDRDNLQVAARLCGERAEPRAFFVQDLPEPKAELHTVALDDLYRFFRNPARFLLKRRLDVHFREALPALADREPFGLAGLERYKLAEWLRNEPERATWSLVRAAGLVPHGAPGQAMYAQLQQQVRDFEHTLRPHLTSPKQPPVEVALELGDFRLIGRLEHLHREHQLLVRYGRVQAKDHLRAWLYHLALNAVAENAHPRQTLLAGLKTLQKGEVLLYRYLPVLNAGEVLSDLVQLYATGLRRPLPFFPDSAYAYVNVLKPDGQNRRQAWDKAWREWSGADSDDGRGESADPYLRRCFGADETALDQAFETLARRVFEPMLAYQQQL